MVDKEIINKLCKRVDETTGYEQNIPTYWKSYLAAHFDVVEVVRCCDCKHRQENPDIGNTCYLTCNLSWGLKGVIDPTDFCSYGERRTENDS